VTKQQLWELILAKNPTFVEGPVRMSTAQLRKMFDLVWEQAQRDMEAVNNVDSIFGEIFGCRR